MNILKKIYLILFAIYLIGPIFVITAVSFNARKFLAFPPKGFSFRWYAEIFVDNGWFTSLLNSLTIALSSAVLAVLIALPVAYVLWKSGLRYAKALYPSVS